MQHTADGNTWQLRALDDGIQYEGLKNFPLGQERVDEAGSCATAVKYAVLGYYWLLKYAVTAQASKLGVDA